MMSEHNLCNKHDLTADEIDVINEEIKGFMFEPSCVDDVCIMIKTVKYPTGKEAEVEVIIRRL